MIKIRKGKFRIAIINIVIFFIAFFVQTSIFPLIPFITCSPNLLLIITFSYGLLYGESIGLITGLICGALCDMYFSGVFGFYILIYSLIGYVNGVFKAYFFENTITFPMILSFLNTLAYNIYIYVTHFLIRGRFDIAYYFINIMAPNIVFTLLVTTIAYKIIYKFVDNVKN